MMLISIWDSTEALMNYLIATDSKGGRTIERDEVWLKGFDLGKFYYEGVISSLSKSGLFGDSQVISVDKGSLALDPQRDAFRGFAIGGIFCDKPDGEVPENKQLAIIEAHESVAAEIHNRLGAYPYVPTHDGDPDPFDYADGE